MLLEADPRHTVRPTQCRVQPDIPVLLHHFPVSQMDCGVNNRAVQFETAVLQLPELVMKSDLVEPPINKSARYLAPMDILALQARSLVRQTDRGQRQPDAQFAIVEDQCHPQDLLLEVVIPHTRLSTL